ncbi:hypothetical protein [Microvirga aerophila]|uniref:Uncharacterized protein n=1 Tax=Microvirga aerophila TaxID=670291 RepID=A0A512C3R1_9HYPH|nr:hypothetical protein [Microvirga aerophila]GEO18841.1 hypothetical protein MAE02_65370 [Microvirga aerophila]
MTTVEFTWGSLLTLAGSAGIIAALVNQGLGWLREWWAAADKRKANAGYMALRLAVLLEAYASACADAINGNESAEHRPEEQYPDWTAKLPELPEYPDDTDGWRSLPIKLAGRVLSFRNKVQESQGIINSGLEHSEDTLEEDYAEQAAQRGLEAWKLAVELRRAYGLEAVEVAWDYAAGLERHFEKARKEIQKRIVRAAKFHAQLEARHPSPPVTAEE